MKDLSGSSLEQNLKLIISSTNIIFGLIFGLPKLILNWFTKIENWLTKVDNWLTKKQNWFNV